METFIQIVTCRSQWNGFTLPPRSGSPSRFSYLALLCVADQCLLHFKTLQGVRYVSSPRQIRKSKEAPFPLTPCAKLSNHSNFSLRHPRNSRIGTANQALESTARAWRYGQMFRVGKARDWEVSVGYTSDLGVTPSQVVERWPPTGKDPSQKASLPSVVSPGLLGEPLQASMLVTFLELKHLVNQPS